MTAKCPACGEEKDSYNAVAIHMWKYKDSTHERWQSQGQAIEYLVEDSHGGGSEETDMDNDKSVKTVETSFPGHESSEEQENETNKVMRPCGHEGFEEKELPAGTEAVTCEECGRTFGVEQ